MDELKTKNIVVRLDGAAYDIYQFLVKHNDRIRERQAKYVRDAAVQGMIDTMQVQVSDLMESASKDRPGVNKAEVLDVVMEATTILAKIMMERQKQFKEIEEQGGR
jgi:hypothetical protein